ncbi:MAG: hypothetical protein ACRD8Z_21660, partial [Nitrososphaeraceae archaeon]
TPNQINNIRIRSPLSLKHFLKAFYKWDGRSTMSVEIMVFRTLPGRGRLSDIVRGYFKGRLGRLSRAQFRQFHLLSRRTSEILRIPKLFSPSFQTYYIIRRAVPRPVSMVGPARIPAVPRPMSMVGPSPTPGNVIRPNDIKIGLDTLGKLKLSFYLNPETLSRLRSLGVLRISTLRKEFSRLMAQNGRHWLKRLFTRLRIPSNFAGLASRLLLRLATTIINKSSTGLIQRILSHAQNPRGVTVMLQIQLPSNITQVIRRVSVIQLPSLVHRLLRSAFAITASAGYNI